MKPQNLRAQLLQSHLALVALMAIVMAGAVFNFFRLGLSIDRILRDNYKSVIAAQNMKEALERQDSAATFYLAGQTERARSQYQANWPRFQKALEVEASNITETGEQALSDDIARRFGLYRKSIEKLLYSRAATSESSSQASELQARTQYFQVLEPQFRALKARAQQVLELNQSAIERANARARAQAQTASWLGIGITIGALGLAVLFARGAINSALTPLLALSQGAEEIGAGHLNRRIELRRSDEIGTLATAFNDMAEKLREARRVEQQRLHRAQKMSDAALESLYDPVIVTDATGSVAHLNRAAQGLFGPAEKAAGLPIARVVHEPRIVEALDRAARQQQVLADEGEESVVPLTLGGARRDYRIRATPMRDDDGALLGAALVLEDITHLRELSRLKTEFIGVASHELRTPVTSLLLSAQLLQEGAAGPLNAMQTEIVDAQREDLQRLESLLSDLLDITRLEAGSTPPRLEMVSASEMIEAARVAVASQAGAKGVELRAEVADGLPNVRADRAQIGRVLINLLSNAIRHTPAGGSVQIEALEQQEQVLVRVSDSGEGIAPDFLPRIFERFMQVPGATRGGAGLGLSIAQAIVKSHGSEIRVQSALGHGSTFEFALPEGKQE